MELGGELYYSFTKDSKIRKCAKSVAAEIRNWLPRDLYRNEVEAQMRGRQKQTNIKRLIDNLRNHPDGPNRNKLGITVESIIDHVKGDNDIYYVYEWKNCNASAVFSIGKIVGRVTAYKVLDEDRNVLGWSGDGNYSGNYFETSPD